MLFWPMRRLILPGNYLRCLLELAFLGLISLTGHAQSVSSVLQTGIWLKIGVTKTGVYRLDYPSLVRQNAAFATADPRQFRLYGNGGLPLPQSLATVRPNDLTENAIQVTGEADGRFDSSDALVFFSQGTTRISYDSTTQQFAHQLNPYADTTYYFLTIGTSPGRRIQTRPAGNVMGPVSTTFTDYAFREVDLVNRNQSGREWLGDDFGSTTEQGFTFNLPGRILNTPISVRTSVEAEATVSTQFALRLGSQAVGTIPVGAVSGDRFDRKGILVNAAFSLTPATSENILGFTMSFDKSAQSSAQGYLNYLAVQLQRELRLYDQSTTVFGLRGRQMIRQASSALQLWQITDPLQPVAQAYTLSGTDATWVADGFSSNNYFIFTDAQVLSPVSFTTLPNQNLHAEAAPDLLIITPAAWQSEARRLASFRQTNDGLSTLVVTNQQVYNEFASGQADPTAIRDLCAYFNRQQAGKLKYLLLFGDATFDYRNRLNLLTPAQQTVTIPVYESRESLHPVYSYSSDDYFGLLNADDGDWAESVAGDELLDLGIGRIPAKSQVEAQAVVDKLISYATDKTMRGDWRTKLLFVADDGDYNLHQNDADRLATLVETQYPAYQPERLFIDSYPQVGTLPNEKAPIVNQRINQALTDGRLIINYTGHGGEADWAQEQILTLRDILSWTNHRLPLLVTATCEFGRYDNPTINSGAELALLKPASGAVSLLTTTRPVFANTNYLLNMAFYQAVFSATDSQRLGDVMRQTKNNSLSGVQNRNFTLLGDPSMRLSYPQAEVALTQLNGRPLSATADTLRALQTVELTGEIRRTGTAQRLSDFSGTVRITLFDKAATQTTLGANNLTNDVVEQGIKMSYKAYTSPLFLGQATVQDGVFRVTFTLPKDLDPRYDFGKLVAYALRADSLLDAAGSYLKFRIGGRSTPDSVDTTPPVITLSLPTGKLVDEPLTVAGPDVTLRVQLSDNQGLNLSRLTTDHLLTARLADSTYILNDFYRPTSGDGRQGEALYTFKGLSNGAYTVWVKAWDVNNNSIEATLAFIVSDRPALNLRVLRTYPNPFFDQFSVEATHNRPGEDLTWTLTFFDLTGRAVASRQDICLTCAETLPVSRWDGRNASGALVPNGMYLYQLQVQSASDQSQATVTGRALLVR